MGVLLIKNAEHRSINKGLTLFIWKDKINNRYDVFKVRGSHRCVKQSKLYLTHEFAELTRHSLSKYLYNKKGGSAQWVTRLKLIGRW